MTKSSDKLAEFDRMLFDAAGKRASDLLLVAGHPPQARVDGVFVSQGGKALGVEYTQALAEELIDPPRLGEILQRGYVDTSRAINGRAYARIAVSRSGGAYSISARIHGNSDLPSLEVCRLPEVVKSLLTAPNGLVLITGPHGSGKTTTLYSLLNWINENRACHICTVEKPRHYLLQPAKAIIQQREVGMDVGSIAAGIAAAMHQDLDVLMLGEIADIESLGAALHAAETGHLVLAHMHANNAADAVDRIIEAAGESAPLVRRQLSEVTRGVLCQQLVRGAQKGRVAVYEVLVPDDDWAWRLRNGEAASALRGGPRSVLMRDDLDNAVAAGLVNDESAKRLREQLGG